MIPQAEQFTNCQPWVLSWQYRKQNIIRELLGYGADILCLQVTSRHGCWKYHHSTSKA